MSSTLLHLVRAAPDPAVELCDHIDKRSIEVSATLGIGLPRLIAQWERVVVDGAPDPGSEEVFIGGEGDAFEARGGMRSGALGMWYRPATPTALRAYAQLLAELADRVEHDATAYGALAARSDTR